MMMTTMLCVWVVLAGVLVPAPAHAALAQATAFAAQPPAQPPAAQDEFVPIDQIPEHDKLPAAPFLIGAYMVAWVAVLLYVWSLWRRLARVEEELKRLGAGSSRP